jgi:hypothetical protein
MLKGTKRPKTTLSQNWEKKRYLIDLFIGRVGKNRNLEKPNWEKR